MAETPTLRLPKPEASGSISQELVSRPGVACALAMLSHPGCVRHANEDACAALPELGAFVVCDGMGGAAGGEVASQLAVEAFLRALGQPARRVERRMRPRASFSEEAGDCANQKTTAKYPAPHPHTRLREAVCAANQAVFRQSRKSAGLRGMGTTLVAALRDESDAGTLWLAHVGDSRGYRVRDGRLELLTEDHSLVEEQVRAGTLSRVEAAVSPIRNIITRAVGSMATVEPEIAAHATRRGDVYLLATDGLTRELDDAQIGGILSGFVPHMGTATTPDGERHAALHAACQALIDAANAQGGHDNITVLLIGCV